ncbi:MAG: hypothetical protein AB4911_15955 [Oscillochloridaceae bacterium umkhey_bin13]
MRWFLTIAFLLSLMVVAVPMHAQSDDGALYDAAGRLISYWVDR